MADDDSAPVFGMLPDHAAISRARGLLQAFGEDDREAWAGILASDQGGTDPAAPYRTFIAMTCFAYEAIGAVRDLSGDDRETVTAKLTAATLHILDKTTEGNDDDGRDGDDGGRRWPGDPAGSGGR